VRLRPNRGLLTFVLVVARSCSSSSSVCPAGKTIEQDDEEEYDDEKEALNPQAYRYPRDSDSFCRRKDSIASYSGKPRRS
jgi:hypothetical protein